MGKKPKDRRGTPQGRTSFAMTAYPRAPITGGYPFGQVLNFRRAKNGVAFRYSIRATGPWVCKNCRCCGSTTAPGSAEPTLPVWFPPQGRPFRSPDSLPLGEGRFPLSGGRLPLSRGDVEHSETEGIGKWLKAKRGRGLAAGQTDEGNGPGYESGPFQPQGRTVCACGPLRSSAPTAKSEDSRISQGRHTGPPGNGPLGASGPAKDQTHLQIRRRGGCQPPAGAHSAPLHIVHLELRGAAKSPVKPLDTRKVVYYNGS